MLLCIANKFLGIENSNIHQWCIKWENHYSAFYSLIYDAFGQDYLSYF